MIFKRMFMIIICFLGLVLFSAGSFAQNTDVLRQEIYSKFRDKRCNMPLSECNCPEAREMKGYIDALLETGIPREEIFYKLAKKFSLKTVLDADLKQSLERRLSQEAGEARPRIAIEPEDFNFGEVDKSQGKVNTVFKITNKGSSDLVIKNLRASCSCTTASLTAGSKKSPYFDTKGAPQDWQMAVKPGEAGELEVVLDLAHNSVKPGDLVREVMIASNDPLYPESSVRVEARVKEAGGGKEDGFSGRLENGIRVVELNASKYKFDPDPVIVKKGERVRLALKSVDVKHGISIPEFNLNAASEVNKTVTTEFTADKQGTFTIHCSVYCGSGHGKMKGKLIVK